MADDGDRKRMAAIGADMERWGVEVRWMPGWETRGATWIRVPWGIVDHHDAASIKSGEWGALGIIVSGRSDVPGPLSQFQVGRGLGDVPRVAIVAAGRANHAGRGGPLRLSSGTVPVDAGNSYLYGAEKANNGLGEPYTDASIYATDALFRAVLERCG